MAGNLESMLLDSSSDDSDNEVLEEVTTGTAVPVASVIAASVQQTAVPPPAPSAPSSNMSQSELSSRLKSLYSPASKAPVHQPPPNPLSHAPHQQGHQQQPQQRHHQQQPPHYQQQQQQQSSPHHPLQHTPAPQQQQQQAHQMQHQQQHQQQIQKPQHQQQQQQQQLHHHPTHHQQIQNSNTNSMPSPSMSPMQQNTSSSMRPLVPNRSSQPAPASTGDPFEPTPLHAMIQRQQAKAAASTPGPPIASSSMPPPAPSNSMTNSSRPPHISSSGPPSTSSSTATVRTANTVPTSSSALSAQARANLEREAKQRKETFLMFTRVLMKYLEQKDPEMHVRAKAVIRECAEKNKNKEAGYESVTASMQTRLRATVGEGYWRKAEEYLDHFLKQKKKLEEAKRQAAQQQAPSTTHVSSSQQQQQQAPSHPQLDQEKADRDRERARHAIAAVEKKAAEAKAAKALINRQKEEEKVRKRKQQQQAQIAAAKVKQQQQAQQAANMARMQRENAAKMAALQAAAVAKSNPQLDPKKKKPEKRKPSSTPVGMPVPVAGSTVARMVASPTPTESTTKPEPPPREYSDLMELVDHAVTYDWTSAGLLLGKESKADLNLNDEQRKLLYGDRARPSPVTYLSPAAIPLTARGWGKRNVVSARVAWAKIRLLEQKRELNAAQVDGMPVVAGLKLPSVPRPGPTTTTPMPTTSALTTWFNEEKAEEDKTLALLSEATEIYLKSILDKALTAARQRQNVDGIRLWHQQHGPQKPPLSLRLGCDLKRQIAQAEGNAAKTCQRMEEALERQPNIPAKLRSLNDDETLYQASSMADLALRPKLASSVEQADYNAKRSFEIHGGKESGGPPFGRVPKKPKILLRDFRLGTEWANFAHQRTDIAASTFL